MLRYSIIRRVETALARTFALMHRRWKMAVRMTKITITESWIASAAIVKRLPNCCVLCDDVGLAESDTPKEFKTSTSAINPPKID